MVYTVFHFNFRHYQNLISMNDINQKTSNTAFENTRRLRIVIQRDKKSL
jgi:hypothetical protein